MVGFSVVSSVSGLVSLTNPFVDYLFVGESGRFERRFGAFLGGCVESKSHDLFLGCSRDSAGLEGIVGVIYPAPNVLFSCLISLIDVNKNPNVHSGLFNSLRSFKRNKKPVDREKVFYNVVSKFSSSRRIIGYLFAGLFVDSKYNDAFLCLARFIIINEMVNHYISTGENLRMENMVDSRLQLLNKAYENYHDLKFEMNDYSLLIAGIVFSSGFNTMVKDFYLDKRKKTSNDYSIMSSLMSDNDDFKLDTFTVARSLSDMGNIPGRLSTYNFTSIREKYDRIDYVSPYHEHCYLDSNHIKVFTRESLRDQGIFTSDLGKLPLLTANGENFNSFLSIVENIALATDSFITRNNLIEYSSAVYAVTRLSKELGLFGLKRQYALLFILMVKKENMRDGVKVTENTLRVIIENFLDNFDDTYVDLGRLSRIAILYAKNKGKIPLSYIISIVDSEEIIYD